jgi:hypothetical protein
MGRRKDAKLTLSFELEKRNLDQAEKGIQGLDKEIKSLNAEMKKLDKTASSTGDSISDSAKLQRAEIEKNIDALQRQRKELEAQATVSRARAQTSGQVAEGAGGVSSGFGALATAAGTAGLGPLQELFTIVDDFANLGEQLPRLATGISDLKSGLSQGTTAAAGLAGATSTSSAAATAATPAIAGVGISLGTVLAAALPIAAVVAAVAVAFNAFTNTLAEAKARLETAVAGQLQYFDIINTGTSESIQSSLDGLEIERQIAEQKIAFLQAQIEQQNLLEKIVSGGELKDALEEQEAQLFETEVAINAHTSALGSEEVAANDAAAAQSNVNKEQAQAAPIAQRSADAIQKESAAKRASTQASKQNVAAINNEIKASKRARRESVSRAEFKIFGEDSKSEAKVDEIAKMRLDALEKERELAKGLVSDIEGAQRDLQSSLAELDRSFKDDEERSERDHEKALKSIRDEARDGEADALRNRDFAALVQIKQDAKKRIREENERFKDEKRERAIDRRIRIRELRIANTERQAEIRRANQQQLLELRNTLMQQLALRRSALEQETSMMSSQFGGLKTFRNSSSVGGSTGGSLPSGGKPFIPSSGGGGVTVPVNVSGNTVNDPKKIAKIAGEKVLNALVEITK